MKGINRRQFGLQAAGVALSAAGAAGALGAMSPRAAFAAAVAPNAAGAMSSKLRTLMMMRGALDDRLVTYWLRGRYYGFVDGAMTPLFGVVNACFSRWRAHPDGGFIGARGEISYYTDFESGVIVQSLPNPYTGEAMQPPARGYPPSPVRIQADATISIKEAPGVQFQNVIHEPEATGEHVTLVESNMARTPLPGGKLSLYNEVVTYRASARDLARGSLQRVPCDIGFTSTVSWRSWMGMGDRPGQLMAVGAGSYVDSLDELPIGWLKATAASQPNLLARPLEFLEPVWKSMG